MTTFTCLVSCLGISILAAATVRPFITRLACAYPIRAAFNTSITQTYKVEYTYEQRNVQVGIIIFFMKLKFKVMHGHESFASIRILHKAILSSECHCNLQIMSIILLPCTHAQGDKVISCIIIVVGVVVVISTKQPYLETQLPQRLVNTINESNSAKNELQCVLNRGTWSTSVTNSAFLLAFVTTPINSAHSRHYACRPCVFCSCA